MLCIGILTPEKAAELFKIRKDDILSMKKKVRIWPNKAYS